jgi:type IV pilus assembly protein PilY1
VVGDGDGLAKIQGLNAEPAGNLISYVYGGDLLGNVWRFDVNDTATAETVGATVTTGKAVLLAVLKDPSGSTQPITVTPILGKSNGETMVLVGTGKYLGASDLANTQIQTQYGIKDRYDTLGTLNNPAGSPRNTTTLQRSSLGIISGTTNRETTLSGASADKGWYADFNITSEAGERVHVDGKLIQGVLIVPSTVPSATACSPGGHGWLNYFDYETGGSIGTSTISRKYDAIIAGITYYFVNGQLQVKVVLTNGDIPDGDPPPTGSSADFQGVRSLWRELIQP